MTNQIIVTLAESDNTEQISDAIEAFLEILIKTRVLKDFAIETAEDGQINY
ncbi:MAG: hypothetical protein HXS54_06095 [Theionarchaea archaeon]|nr:hypothetical protein [Theionarchaea archaeon]DBA34830.1 TPA_asm: hypothetical protein vir521_00036 [Caudoviricetes sp. vir521]